VNKKITAVILDIFAIVIWVLGSVLLYQGKIPFIWDGVAFYVAGLIVFVIEDSYINHAVKRLIQALIGIIKP
jgi:hypothetical protein